MFTATKGSSLGGRITPDEKHLILATIEDGLTIIEKVDANWDDLGQFIEKGVDLFYQIKSFFDDLLNRLPTKIKVNGCTYRLNELPAPGKAEDTVLYRCEEHPNEVLFSTNGRNMPSARNKMFQKLIDEQYLF